MITQTFHIANIQNILTKTETGERGMFLRNRDKMGFLRDQCKGEEPLFLAYSENCLKPGIVVFCKLQNDACEDRLSHISPRERERASRMILTILACNNQQGTENFYAIVDLCTAK